MCSPHIPVWPSTPPPPSSCYIDFTIGILYNIYGDLQSTKTNSKTRYPILLSPSCCSFTPMSSRPVLHVTHFFVINVTYSLSLRTFTTVCLVVGSLTISPVSKICLLFLFLSGYTSLGTWRRGRGREGEPGSNTNVIAL